MARRILRVARKAAFAFLGASAVCMAETPPADCTKQGFPTPARVEFVQECMMKSGGEIANLYKCSCAVDWIAKEVSYDDFVEWETFARNASMAGERGGVFRDTDEAKKEGKQYRDLESEAYQACGVQPRK
jgi:hypothetical protein